MKKKCPWCDSEKTQMHLWVKDFFLTGEAFEIHECLKCGLLFTEPRPDSNHVNFDYSLYIISGRPYFVNRKIGKTTKPGPPQFETAPDISVLFLPGLALLFALFSRFCTAGISDEDQDADAYKRYHDGKDAERTHHRAAPRDPEAHHAADGRHAIEHQHRLLLAQAQARTLFRAT